VDVTELIDHAQQCIELAGQNILNTDEYIAIELSEDDERSKKTVGKAAQLEQIQTKINMQLQQLEEARKNLRRDCSEMISSSKRNQDLSHSDFSEKCGKQAFRIRELENEIKN
jgi:Fe2+ transport system protein B